MDIGKIAKALAKLGVKNADEATPEMIQKATKLASQEMKDAPNNLVGKGKNLEALKKAKENIVEKNYADAPPSYSKNVGRDEVNHKLVHDPNDVVMVPEGTHVPATRKSTIPAVVETTAKKVDDNMLPVVRGNTLPETPVALVDDLAQKSGMSGATKAKIIAGGATAAGLGAGLLMRPDEQESQALDPLTTMAVTSAVPAIVEVVAGSGKKEGRLPADVATSNSDAAIKADASVKNDDYVTQLLAEQEKQKELDFVDNLLRAGSTVGNALATPDKKLDTSGIDALQAQNSRGVENLKQKMKTEAESGDLNDERLLRDPNSDMSKNLRSMLSELGYPVGDNVSGKQLKDMGINVYNLIASKEAREAARLNREAVMDNSNIEKTKSSIEKRFQNLTTSKDYKAYQATKDAIQGFEYALATDDKEAVGTAFMKFAKSAQGDDSVVRSEDMKTLAGGTPFADPKKMLDHYTALAKGKNFTKVELQNMKKIMEASLKAKAHDVQRLANPMLQKIRSNNLPMDEYIDPTLVAELEGAVPAGGGQPQPYTEKQEAAINLVMKNNGVDRNTAINALKKAKKL
jgi:NACalpha-BTF3-like transcription factor